MEADRDGRCVVLPCKIGSLVYSHARKLDGQDYMKETEFWWSDIPELGKTVFLNPEAADVAPVVHGTPILRYRPERYERYEEAGLSDRGEMLYIKRVYVDEKNWAMYCPACGKRLCSRFINYCPHCGAKMDGGLAHGKT